MISKPFTILLILTLTLALTLLLVWPLYQEYQEVKFKIKSKKVKLENRENYFNKLQAASHKLEQYQLEVDKVKSAFPSYPDFPSLFRFFQKVASDNGLVLGEITSIGISSEQETKAKKLELKFEVIGSYSAFKNFISALENSSRLIEINSISYTTQEGTSSFKLKLSTNY